MRLGLAVGMVVLLAAATAWQGEGRGAVQAQGRVPAGTAHTGKAFRFNKLKDGIYHAIGTGALTVIGNSAVIVNDEDVVIEIGRASCRERV